MLIYNAEIHTMGSLGVVKDGWIDIQNGKIRNIGSGYLPYDDKDAIDAQGGMLLPDSSTPTTTSALSRTVWTSRGTTATSPPIHLLPR